MAITSLSDLKQGHLYKFSSGNYSVTTPANSYIKFFAFGKLNTNLTPAPSYSAEQYLGNKTGSTTLASLYFWNYSYFSVFHGEFYFIFDSYVGDPSNMLQYITEDKDFFVYDRTINDVNYAKQVIATANLSLVELKGCLNVFDLARIESNMQMLWEELDEWGYQMTSLTFKFDWTFDSLLDSANVARILGNINSIADDFYRPQGWETMPTTLKSYGDINKIEKNIYLMKTALDEIQRHAFRSGAFNAFTRNGEYYILPLRVE